MSNFIFLTEANSEGPVTYYAIPDEKIETLNEFETYDRYGQQIGHEAAGDYHIDNEQSPARQDCISAIQEKFRVIVNIDTHNEVVEWIDNTEVDEWISDQNDPTEAGEFIAEINSFISEWVEENSTITTLRGFDYWDGSNWRTVVVEREHTGRDNTSHQILDDQELMAELNEAIENKKFVKSEFGKEKYQSDRWEIVVNNFQGSWASYEIREIEEED